MPEHGYIKLHRQIQDCWIWDSGKFDKRSAWIDLLMLANHRDKKIMFDSEYIVITRGQFMTSIRKLSGRWKWSKSAVTAFLNLLEKDSMIKRDSDNRRTLITIINYEVYQGIPDSKETVNGTQSGTVNGTQSGTQNGTTKNIRNKEYIKEKDIPNGISKKKAFTPPTVEEVRAYCQERGNNIDPQRFVDFYESKGWFVGKNKMKSWEAAVRNWESRDKQNTPKQSNAETWGAKIYDLRNEQNYPFFGFPEEWFDGHDLNESRVTPVIHPIDKQRGIYEEFMIKPQELIDLYKLRRDYYEQRK